MIDTVSPHIWMAIYLTITAFMLVEHIFVGTRTECSSKNVASFNPVVIKYSETFSIKDKLRVVVV